MSTNGQLHFPTPIQRGNARPIVGKAIEARRVEDNGSTIPERMLLRLVRLVAVGHHGDGADDVLGQRSTNMYTIRTPILLNVKGFVVPRKIAGPSIDVLHRLYVEEQ